MIKEKIGEKLVLFRTIRKLTQDDVASGAGIEITKYKRIEGNTQVPDEDALEKLCKYFGVSLADFQSKAAVVVNLGTIEGTQHIENYFSDQKDLLLKVMGDKDKEIERLAKQVEQLMKMLEKKK